MNITPEQALAMARKGADDLKLPYYIQHGKVYYTAAVDDGTGEPVGILIFDPANNAEDLNALIEHYKITVAWHRTVWIAVNDAEWQITGQDKSRKLAQLKCLMKVMGIE